MSADNDNDILPEEFRDEPPPMERRTGRAQVEVEAQRDRALRRWPRREQCGV
jgi:hypothetical protein